MTHDRAHADNFTLTHKLLADMFGLRRNGVSIAAGVLQKRKHIRYTRAVITILNRKGLKAASSNCYTTIADDYTRAFT